DESFSRFGVFLELKDGVTPEMVIDEIEALAGEGVKGNFYSLKSSITSLMESTALDGNASIVLGIILIILSLIGAISMMMGHLLKRKNEIGVKQSIGASNLIIYKEIFKDMFFVTLTSNILSLYGAFMITKYILPGWLILMNIGIAISLGILITILPVRGILKIQIVDLLRRKG
ncbi:MAG: FtsX-like permease family protein, partial [Clostridium sp.]